MKATNDVIRVYVLLHRTEADEIATRAARTGVSRSEYMRRVALDSLSPGRGGDAIDPTRKLIRNISASIDDFYMALKNLGLR